MFFVCLFAVPGPSGPSGASRPVGIYYKLYRCSDGKLRLNLITEAVRKLYNGSDGRQPRDQLCLMGLLPFFCPGVLGIKKLIASLSGRCQQLDGCGLFSSSSLSSASHCLQPQSASPSSCSFDISHNDPPNTRTALCTRRARGQARK